MNARSKQYCRVVSFPTTTAAMAFQAAGKKKGFAGRLIPLPPQINAGCGLAWCCISDDEEKLFALIDEECLLIEGCYLVELIL